MEKAICWRDLLTDEYQQILNEDKGRSISTINTARIKRSNRRVLKLHSKTLKWLFKDGSIISFGLVVN